MPGETQTLADMKFLSGNFIEASALYTEALLSLGDESDDKDMVSLLQKLGDSQFAAELYDEALGTYERLLQLQEQCQASDREKISTHLRLAEIDDLSHRKPEAEIQFKTAYEMAELHLPPQHFLWQSVVKSYLDWLKKTGGDSSLIAKLQEEIATPVKFEVSSEMDAHQAPPAEQRASSVDKLRESTSFELGDSFAHIDIDSRGGFAQLESNLPSRHDVAMRQSMRSFFNYGAKASHKKKEHSHSDSEGSRRGYHTRLANSEELQNQLAKIMPLVLIALLLSVLIALSVGKRGSSELPPFYREFLGKTFMTSDGVLSMTAGADGLKLTGKAIHKTIKPAFWKGTLLDDMRLLRGDYRNCIWLYPSPQGLRDQNGIEFLAQTEIEGKTIRALQTIAEAAQSFYLTRGRYPIPAEIASTFRYRNPCTDNIDPVPAYSMFSYHRDAATRSSRFESSIESGQYFNNESVGKPGAIAALSIINKQTGLVEVPDAPVECQILYLHGFDRAGQLITCPGSGKTLILSLIAGKTEQTEDNKILSRYSNATFCMSAKQPPMVAAVFFKYFAGLLSLAAIIGYLLWIHEHACREDFFS